MTMTSKRRFIHTILNVDSSKKELDDSDKLFKEWFLKNVPTTEENLNCLNHVKYGGVIDHATEEAVIGLLINSNGVLLSDIMNAIEDIDEIPDEIKSYFPDLTTKEWQASLRAITVILTALEKYISPNDKKQKSLFKYISEQEKQN